MNSIERNIQVNQPASRGIWRFFINVNYIYILIPETFIWIAFVNFDLALSPPHKIFLLIITWLFLLAFRPFAQLNILITTVLFSASTLYAMFNGATLASVQDSSGDIFRLLLVFSTFYYFKWLAQETTSAETVFKRFIWISFLVISANLLLGAMGFGNVQRGMGIGTRGFFVAGNDISTITCIVAAFVLSESYERNAKSFLLYLLLFVYYAYLLNTKAFIFSFVIIIVCLPLYGNIKKRIDKKIFIRISAFVCLLPFLLVGAYLALDQIDFWDPYFAFIDQFQNDSWITFLLSRRDQYLMNGLTYASENFNLFNYFFGFSSGDFLRATIQRAEIDPFEIFFYFGLVGVVLAYGWFVQQIRRSFSAGVKGDPFFSYHRAIFACNVFLLLQSLTSGHVFMSALVCIYLGAINGMLYWRKEKAE